MMADPMGDEWSNAEQKLEPRREGSELIAGGLKGAPWLCSRCGRFHAEGPLCPTCDEPMLNAQARGALQMIHDEDVQRMTRRARRGWTTYLAGLGLGLIGIFGLGLFVGEALPMLVLAVVVWTVSLPVLSTVHNRLRPVRRFGEEVELRMLLDLPEEQRALRRERLEAMRVVGDEGAMMSAKMWRNLGLGIVGLGVYCLIVVAAVGLEHHLESLIKRFVYPDSFLFMERGWSLALLFSFSWLIFFVFLLLRARKRFRQ